MDNTQQCESCQYCEYDDYSDSYECMMNLDEDELSRFYSQSKYSCPYYKYYDEYTMVRKQN